MQKVRQYFSLILCGIMITACQPNPSEKDFNAYLPPPFSSIEEKIPSPIEAEKPSQADIWDVSDIDISYIQPNKKLIAFTFDDGPSKTMENLIATFADYNEQNPDCRASATFFLNGTHITEESLPLLHTAHILNCELGNHTHHHFNLTTIPLAEVAAEIQATDHILSKVDGNPLHLLRPPFGIINEDVKAILKTPVINWTIDTLDWTGASEDAIYNSVFAARFPGAIVLMHDGYHNTVNALKRLLPDLKADGYQVVNVSALSKANRCTLKSGKEYIRARKQ